MPTRTRLAARLPAPRLQTAKPAAPALVVAATDNLEGLKGSFEWALQKLAKPGAQPAAARPAGRRGCACG